MGQRYRELMERRRHEGKRQGKAAKREQRCLEKTCFVGWWRKDTGSPWRRIVHDTDEARCFNRLLNAVRGGDKVMLPAGKNPNASE